MSEEIAGRGDPLKVLHLLWGRDEGGRRGPKPKANLHDIIAAAIAIADTEGLAAVSTRRVAEAVGISPMSFYTYIPGKAELLDLMLDAAAVDPEGKQAPAFNPHAWRDNLTWVARSYRDHFLRHPWLLELYTHRPVLGPNTLLGYEVALSAVDGLGLDEIEMDMCVTLMANYVYGAVRDVARSRRVKELTGLTDDEWWTTIEPFLETIDFSSYPVSSRIGPVVGEEYGLGDPDRAFAFGLERILDGIGLLITRKTQV
jgi:AcrR family transcriptional regulator